ncbi:unnamed protein product, partial [Clonostachys rosea f. rosea IK726]
PSLLTLAKRSGPDGRSMDQPAEDGPAALPAEGMSPPAGLADPWPPADADADAGIFAGFSVDEASDTLDAYHRPGVEERTGGHPKMEARLGLIGGLEQTMRLLYEHCEATQLVILFSGPPDAVVESNGYRMGRLRSQIAALGAFVESTRRVLHDGV